MHADVRAELLSQVSARYGTKLRAVFLVGSQARGDARPFSNIDLQVLTESQTECIRLFPQGELATVNTISLEDFLAAIYSPVGQQVIDWWLTAGGLRTAIPWWDPSGVLTVAQRIASERRPLVELYGRILWDQQLKELREYQIQLLQAGSFDLDYFIALARFCERAESALVLYHGGLLDRWELSSLKRPKSFLSDWATLWCLGAEPKQVNLALAADAIVQAVKGIWQANRPQLASSLSEADLAGRQRLLDRIPGRATGYGLPTDLPVTVELMDSCLAVAWAAVKHLLQREPVGLLRQANRLCLLFGQSGLLVVPELAELISQARIPEGADLTTATLAAASLVEGLEKVNQSPTIVPQPTRRKRS